MLGCVSKRCTASGETPYSAHDELGRWQTGEELHKMQATVHIFVATRGRHGLEPWFRLIKGSGNGRGVGRIKGSSDQDALCSCLWVV